MAEHEYTVDPERFERSADLAMSVSSADDVRLIQELVGEHLETTPTPASRLLVPHIAEHFMHVYPAVLADDRAAAVLTRLGESLGRDSTDVTPDDTSDVTPLAVVPDAAVPGDRDDTDPAVVFAFPYAGAALGAGAALIAGYYILEAIAAYCGDVHPAPGQSAEVNC